MAEQIPPLAMHGLRIFGENYDNISKNVQRVRSKKKPNGEQEHVIYYDKGKSRPRARSTGDDRGRSNSRGAQRDDDYYDSYESEGSVPPVNRRRSPPKSQAVAQRGGGGEVAPRPRPRRRGTSSSSSSASSSSEDLGSSTDDEKKEKKMRRGEMIAGGLAAVATVHAAGVVWGSMNARDAREEAVANGELTKEDAKRERRKNQFQDVAAIGLAALAVKGAYGKWKGTAGQHKNRKEHLEDSARRHWKRVERGVDREGRKNSINYGSGRRSGSAGRSKGAIAPPPDRKQITDGRPAYNRAYSQSENDLRSRSRYDDYDYDEYDRAERGSRR